MNENRDVKLTAADICAIESILSEGNRAELIPTRERVRVIRIMREQVADGIKYKPNFGATAERR